MPIYAYRCASCGHAKDVLQRMSDPVLTTCPACSAESFEKQVTAAGFQLKGSGWYVTDFKPGSKPATPATPAAASNGDSAGAETASNGAKPDAPKTDAATPAAAAAPASAPATPSAAPSTGAK
jgi:putative FmdB family regulatory protein